MMRECDTLLMVGSNLPNAEFRPRPGRHAASRSTSGRATCRYATRWRFLWRATRPRTLCALLPLLSAPSVELRLARDAWRARIEMVTREAWTVPNGSPTQRGCHLAPAAS